MSPALCEFEALGVSGCAKCLLQPSRVACFLGHSGQHQAPISEGSPVPDPAVVAKLNELLKGVNGDLRLK